MLQHLSGTGQQPGFPRRGLVTMALLFSAACNCSGPRLEKLEQCHNGVDDDDNGLVDCSDPKCFEQGGCFGSCLDLCSIGDGICESGGARQCGRLPDAGCLAYLPAVPCDAGVCSSGACVPPPCTDRCAPQETLCSGTGATLSCQRLSTGCFDWAALTPCAQGQTCSGGACVAADGGCSNACTAGATRCTSSGFEQRCAATANGCTDWGMPGPRCGTDAGSADAGEVTFSSACPLRPYTPVCGGAGGSFGVIGLSTGTNDLLQAVWAPPDGGAPYVSGLGTVHRVFGSTLVPELDAGDLTVIRFAGSSDTDLWAMSVSSGDITRVLHRTSSGWSRVVHSTTETGVDLASDGTDTWVLGSRVVWRIADGGLEPHPLPADTAASSLVAKSGGELWISAFAQPCPGLDGGAICPRVVHGRPGAWAVEDFPCLPGAGANQLWQRAPDDLVVIGSSYESGSFHGFLTHRLDGGWAEAETSAGWAPVRIDGESGAGWILAYGGSVGYEGLARYDGCVHAPSWLCTSANANDPNNCGVLSVSSTAAGSWAIGGRYEQNGWRAMVWRGP